MQGSYEIHSLDDTCWRIEENGVRSFLITGERQAVLLDSGFGTGNIRQVAESLTKLPILLVNTHADRDHTGCNSLFDMAHMHPAEYDRYHRGDGAGLPVEPLWEGDVIDVGGRRLEVILIPGHTPGSIALLDEQSRVLFSGDSVQSGAIYMFGPGRNLDAYIHSMAKLESMSSRFDTVYPSHGELPLKPELVGKLKLGACRMREGAVAGKEATFMDVPALVYDVGAAKFLYDGGKA